jgi:hypothetical protein
LIVFVSPSDFKATIVNAYFACCLRARDAEALFEKYGLRHD